MIEKKEDAGGYDEGSDGGVAKDLKMKSGAGHARNVAIRGSRGRYLCLLDADDIMHPSRIRLQLAAAREAGPGTLAIITIIIITVTITITVITFTVTITITITMITTIIVATTSTNLFIETVKVVTLPAPPLAAARKQTNLQYKHPTICLRSVCDHWFELYSTACRRNA
jgi:glycosyltransferase involved in cell wall biosynthesis